MGAHVQISPEEYLATSYEPDREYVDGEVVERNLGDEAHARTQWLLSGEFHYLARSRPVFGYTELRMELGRSVYRIPDVAVFAGRRPDGPVPSTPPLVVIEILSPDDTHTAVVRKLEEYRAWGVPHIWMADPALRKLYTYRDTGLHEVPAFTLPEFELRLASAEVFGA